MSKIHTPMQVSVKGFMETAFYEGVCQTKYLDSVGVATIGIGSTRSDIPDLASWSWDKKLELQTAFNLYVRHMQKYVDGVNRALKVKQTQSQFDALVSICYNIGIAGITNSTFMKRINMREPISLIRAGVMMWTKQKELVPRRTNEANLYTNGTYVSKGRVLLFPVSANTHKPVYSKGVTIQSLLYIEKALGVQEDAQAAELLPQYIPVPDIGAESARDSFSDDVSEAWAVFKDFFTVKETK